MGRNGAAALAAILALASAAPVARADEPDAVMAQFFSTWDRNADVTPEAVASLYGRRVVYYGRALTNGEVYANKAAFVRRWPDRRYAVVPGTVVKGCDGARCNVGVTLRYRACSDSRGATASGYTRVDIVLAREDGQFKIVRERGRPLARP